MAQRQAVEVMNHTCRDLASAIEYCFEKTTLKSGEEVWLKVREKKLLEFVADLVRREKLFGWVPHEEYDHITINDDSHDWLIFRKQVLGYTLNWEITPAGQIIEPVKDQDDRKKVLVSKYGPECIQLIERYESLKTTRTGLLHKEDPDKIREIKDLTTQIQSMKDEMQEIMEHEMPEMLFYKATAFLYFEDEHGMTLYSEFLENIPEEKRRILLEEAQTIRYVFSSDWMSKFDEAFCKGLQSKLYKTHGKIKELGEEVKTILDKPRYLISCPVNQQKAKYVEENEFNPELFMMGFEKAIKETCKRYQIGNLHPELGKTWEKNEFLAGISLMELRDVPRRGRRTLRREEVRGKRGEILVLYDGENICFICPRGGFYEKLNEAMTAYNGALAWMFYGSQKSNPVSIRDLCVGYPGFSNMVQEKILKWCRKNLKR